MDKEFQTILKDTKNFSTLDKSLQNNKEFIIQCLPIKRFVIQLKHISSELKDDKDFMRSLIIINSLSIAYASERLQKDKELIYAAWVFDKNKKDPMIWDFLDASIAEKYKSNPEQLIEDFEIEQRYENLNSQLVLKSITPHKSKI